ncbi:jerky protein homolog-like [Tetranychus urticae]|uniref:jerky protein homolog-like n=1 Tax=Tetranychus urticae TaxID=32264 RepID=UPI00077BDAAA|nr:jerky protein homolog-like [Tetranychus urticae]
MTLKLFDHYLSEWHKELIEKDEKIALIIDNFAGHKVDENKFPNIQFYWLPPQTTSHLQPMDNGIIKAFKNKYVQHLFQRFSEYLDQNMSLNDIMKNINIFDALKWINDSWSEVSMDTIINCWNHAGYREEIVDESLIIENIENNNEDDNVAQMYSQLTEGIKDSPTLVEYMDRLTMNDLNTYSVSDYESTRSL